MSSNKSSIVIKYLPNKKAMNPNYPRVHCKMHSQGKHTHNIFNSIRFIISIVLHLAFKCYKDNTIVFNKSQYYLSKIVLSKKNIFSPK